MKKIIFTLILSDLFLVFGLALTNSSVKAVTYKSTTVVNTSPSPSPSASPSPTHSIQEVNSFELFWPMVAGKTKGNSMYFLKTLKEKVRGFFIFSPALKANYKVFLSVKRLLEVETLLKENKADIANQTIQEASKDVDSAIEKADKSKKDDFSVVSGQMHDRLSKMQTLIDWLVTKYPDSKSDLTTLKSKIISLEPKI